MNSPLGDSIHQPNFIFPGQASALLLLSNLLQRHLIHLARCDRSVRLQYIAHSLLAAPVAGCDTPSNPDPLVRKANLATATTQLHQISRPALELQ